MYRRYYRNGDMESMSPQLSCPVMGEHDNAKHEYDKDQRSDPKREPSAKKPQDTPSLPFTDKLVSDGKFLGKWATDEVILLGLIFLLMQGKDTDTMLVLALVYIMLS